jgi:hypothetical protein
MTRAIDDLITALQRADARITVAPRQALVPEEEGRSWRVHHPDAFTAVHLQSETGEAPFVVASDFSPPTVVKTVDAAVRMIVQRLGLGIGA